LKAAARHNLREIGAERGRSFHPALAGQNRIFSGPSAADEVSARADSLLAQAGIRTLRKDAVRAIEIIVSLPESTSVALQDQVFSDTVVWAQRYFGAPLLSAVAHRDESMPHCHLLILPLVDGRMIGSKLVGYKGKLRAMLQDFDNKVGEPNGLTAPVPLSPALRRNLLAQAHAVLQTNSGLQDNVLAVLLQPHEPNPLPLMKVLRLSTAQPSGGFAQFIKIMTKPVGKTKSQRVKAKRPEAAAAANPGHLDSDLHGGQDAARE
jgi:hypothetical protein